MFEFHTLSFTAQDQDLMGLQDPLIMGYSFDSLDFYPCDNLRCSIFLDVTLKR